MHAADGDDAHEDAEDVAAAAAVPKASSKKKKDKKDMSSLFAALEGGEQPGAAAGTCFESAPLSLAIDCVEPARWHCFHSPGV